MATPLPVSYTHLQCRVMEETLGEAPIILLDDVLSELDKTRREYFLHGKHPGQVFIT